MALVLVEGEGKLPSILGNSNITSASEGPQSGNGVTSSASSRTVEYVSRCWLVLCVVVMLAAVV